MKFRRLTAALFIALLTVIVTIAPAGRLQAQQSDSVQTTPSQRVTVLKSRLDGLQRSLKTAISALSSQGKQADDKAARDSSLTRLKGLEREVSALLSESNDARGKIERSERLPDGTLDKLDATYNELEPRVQSALKESAGDRAAAGNKPKKKKGKFLGIFGGGDDERIEELTGTVAPGRDRELFEEAAKEVRKSRYETGRLLFNTIITTYPDSPYLPMAKLAIADSFYLEGTSSALIQAAAAYQDWLTFFPTHPLSDRVLLKTAECEMRQMGLPDREIPRAIKAQQRLKVGLQQYPNSPLRPLFEERLKQVQENLAMHDKGVGDFYYTRYKNQQGGLKGAQSRYQDIVAKYPAFSRMDEVLVRLADTYIQEEEPDEAAKYLQRLVRDYPNCPAAEKAREQLTVIGAEIPEPDAARAKIPCAEHPGLMSSMMTEISGSANVEVDKDGVLVSRNRSEEKRDLLDAVIERQGELPPLTTPTAPTAASRP